MPCDPAALEAAEDELEQWLVEHAKAGVPEIVLVGLLRDYAQDVERRGFVPRRWYPETERPDGEP